MAALILVALGCACATGGQFVQLLRARQRVLSLQASMHAPEAEIVTIRLAATPKQEPARAAPTPQSVQDAPTDDSLQQTPASAAAESPAQTEAERQRCARLAALQQENAELVGWIALADTPIDYPVMQSVSRRWHYLDHDFSGARSKSGTPFLEEACALDGNRANWIIYGHNMKNGSMFGGLHKLADAAFFASHRTLTFDTPARTGRYRIAAVFYATLDPDAAFSFYHYPNLTDAQTFAWYAKNVLSASLYPADTALNWGDELLTLVTCVRGKPDKRLVVVAKRE